MSTLGIVSTLSRWKDPSIAAFYFSTMAKLPNEFTYSGAAGRFYIDDQENFKRAGQDEPRFEMGSDGIRYLLIEPQSTNHTRRSNSPSIWGHVRGRISAEVSIGGLNMAKYIPDTQSGSPHYVDASAPAGSISVGNSFSAQICVMPDEYDECRIEIFSGGSGPVAASRIHLGTLTSTSSAFTARKLKSGLVLIKAQGLTAIAGAVGHLIRITPAKGANSGTGAGNDSDGLWVGGGQVEPGIFCTSLIETTTSVVTRTAELLDIRGENFSKLWNPSAWGLIVDVRTETPPSTRYAAAIVSVSGNDPRASLGVASGGQANPQVGLGTGGDQQTGVVGNVYDLGRRGRQAIGYNSGAYRSAARGVLGATPITTPALLSNAVSLTFSQGHNQRAIHIFRYYGVWFAKRSLTNDEMQEATRT